MAKSLHARLVAYRPFGARIGVLAEPVSFSASMLHDDDGAISIEYSMLSGDAQAFDRELTDGLEVAVEVSDGSGFKEPDNARFVITGRSGKTDDRTRTVTYSGQSISWLLSKAENNDSSHLLADGDNKARGPSIRRIRRDPQDAIGRKQGAWRRGHRPDARLRHCQRFEW